MRTASNTYNRIIANDSHRFEVKINIAGVDYGEDKILSCKSDSKVFATEPTIGGVYSSTLEFSILDDGTNIPRMAKVIPYFRATDGTNTSEWIKYGEFYIDTRSVSMNNSGISVFDAFCYDAMLKANAPYSESSLSWPAKAADILAEICSKFGIEQDARNPYNMNPDYFFQLPVGYTYREVLSFIASAYGSNFFMNDEGALRLAFISEAGTLLNVGDNITTLSLSPRRPLYTKVIFHTGDTTQVVEGVSDDNVLEAQNPFATQEMAQRIYASVSGDQSNHYTYKPFDASGAWVNPLVELCDSIRTKKVANTGPIASRVVNFGSGMVMDLSAPNDNYIDHEYAYESPEERQYKRTIAGLESSITLTEQGINLLSEKIENVGGRNLLLKSRTKHISPNNSPTISFEDNISVPEWGCNDGMRAYGSIGSGAAFGLLAGISATPQTSIDGQKYVFSIYIKNNDSVRLNVTVNGLAASQNVEPGESKRLAFYAEGNGTRIVRFGFGSSSTFDFVWWHPQIEYGEVVTSWNPAPEDAETAIAANTAQIAVNASNIALKVSQTDYNGNTIASLINQSATTIQINASKIDLQGYVTLTNLSTSGQTAINGANITTGLIKDAQNKNSWNLDTGALTITDGSVNITTSAQDSSVISLNYLTYNTTIRPNGIEVSTSDSTKSYVYIYDNRVTIAQKNGASHINATYSQTGFTISKWEQQGGGVVSTGIASLNGSELWLGIISSSNPQITGANGKISINSTSSMDEIVLDGATGSITAKGNLAIDNGTNGLTYSPGANNGLFALKRGNNYTFLLWPDSNGAGRLVLGDGTSTKWRTELTNSGLVFRNASDVVTASYPASGFERVVTAAENYTLSSGGYAAWTKPTGYGNRKLIAANVYRYTSATGAFNVLAYNGNATSGYIVGTPGVTINGLEIECIYN